MQALYCLTERVLPRCKELKEKCYDLKQHPVITRHVVGFCISNCAAQRRYWMILQLNANKDTHKDYTHTMNCLVSIFLYSLLLFHSFQYTKLVFVFILFIFLFCCMNTQQYLSIRYVFNFFFFIILYFIQYILCAFIYSPSIRWLFIRHFAG